MTRRITVSSIGADEKAAMESPFATEYNTFLANKNTLTPVGAPNTSTSWPSEVKKQPEEIRFTKRQAALAAHVAQTWQGNIESWSDFTQHTTFHGIKYIFDNDNPHKWRRYVWIMCVFAAISTFLMNFGQTMTNYFAYKTNVGVQILYLETCPLPAVTICNQNNYRITAANEENLFTFIDDFYGTDDISSLNVSSFPELEKVSDSEGFIKRSAHQLEDFIDKCTWRSKRCNLATDFEMTATDLGICYTFNSGNDGEVKSVLDSGSSVALSLILNVEQYEYMRGPQNDAGIKILLHDQGEFPGARDLGFAAAPGTHTLVGIHRTQVKGLPPPHGTCQKGVESVPNCKLKCKTEEVYKRCGCRDIYMSTNITLNAQELSVPICNSTYLFFCVNKALEEIRGEQMNCNCPVPCDQISYEPSLSYAQLSHFNVERLVLTNFTRREMVKEQFRLAKEVTQRLDKPIIDSDHAYIEKIQAEVSRLRSTVEEFIDIYTTGYFMELCMDTDFAIEHDADLLFQWINDILIPFAQMPRHVNLMKDAYKSLKDAMKPTKETQLSELYGQCKHNLTFPNDLDMYRKNTTTGSSRKKRSEELIDWKDEWSVLFALENYMEGDYEYEDEGEEEMLRENTVEMKSCDSYMEETFSSMLDFPSDFEEKLDTLMTMNSTYQASIASIFPNIDSNAEALARHSQCLMHIARVQEELIPRLTSTNAQLNDWVATTTVAELIPKTADLEESAEETLDARVFDYEEMFTECFWVNHVLDLDDLSYIAKTFLDASSDISKVVSRAASIISSAEAIQTGLNQTLVPRLEILEAYRDANSTKMGMAIVLTSDGLDRALMALREDVNDLSSAAKSVTQTTSDIGASQYRMMSIMAGYDVSIVKEDGYAKLQQPREVLQYDPEFTPSASSLEMKVAVAIGRLFNVMLKNVTETSDALSCIYETINTDVSHYKKKMETYLNDVEMNSNFYMGNFLQVDVFYKELKYELIQTNEAFSRGSMFGEIGGFLGLLLGASVLTVCEVLDHVILATVNWCAKRKRRKLPKKKKNAKIMF